MENENINIDVVKIKKTRNRKCKYTDEERAQKVKENQRKYRQKTEVKERMAKYYIERYHNLPTDEKQKLINNISSYMKEKYNNMTDEEYNIFLVKCRPYKNKYNKTKAEQKKIEKEKEKEKENNNIEINKEVYIFV